MVPSGVAMSNLLQDVRYALRALRANPRFSAAAIAALMLGIGANGAIFSVVKGVLLEPLRFPEPQRLVRIFETNAKEGRERAGVAPANFVDWRRESRSFEGIAAASARRLALTGAGEPDQILAMVITDDLFPTLRAHPSLGRLFLPEEYKATDPPENTTASGVVILSDSLWRRRFGADASVIGRMITVEGGLAMIVGVLPPDFGFTEIPGWGTADCWIPQTYHDGEQPRFRQLSVLARLRPGVALAQAQAEMDLVAHRLEDARPAANRGWGARVVPLRDTIIGDIRRELLVLLGAVAFVLLIACANTASLLLARAAVRQREIAIRTALGASRGRIIRQLLTESTILALLAAIGGFVLAHWGVRALVALAPARLPRVDEIRVDGGVLGFTVGLALLTGLGCGLAPALSGSAIDLVSDLKKNTTRSQLSTRSWLGRGLIVAEIGLALVLLTGAGLMVRTLLRLHALDLGFEPKNLLSIGLNPDTKRYRTRDARLALYDALTDRVRAVPGVVAAGLGEVPLIGSMKAELRLEGSTDGYPAAVDAPAPDYFRALGLRLVDGRLFDATDRADGPPVAIVNRTASHRLWPGDTAIGKRVCVEDPVRGPWRTVVGIVEDARRSSLEAEPQLGVYVPLAQSRTFLPGNLLVRTTTDPARLLPEIRHAIWSVDRDQPLTRIATMEDRLARALAPRRFNLILMGSFSLLAFVLAALGIYGVMSYTVSLRTRELGIRIALGADRRRVLALVLGQGLALVAAGEALGLASAWLLHRVMTSMVFGVTTTDPVTFIGVALVWALVGLAACYAPARRATEVDPVVALRYE
jgi:predicted permease